jgi:hypothetical protein
MKRLAIVTAVVFVLVASAGRPASAQELNPDRDPLRINPIPEPSDKEKDEDRDPLEVIGSYFANRFWDFCDIFTLKVGLGNYRSIGFQARLCRPLQIGAGIFEGNQFVLDRGTMGVMKQAEIEGGISVFYPAFIARKVKWQTKEAAMKNLFFGDVGDRKGPLTKEDLKMYDDELTPWGVTTAQIQVPCFLKLEASIRWCEMFDFLVSWLGIPGVRVPDPYYYKQHPSGEYVPAPSVFWHGQEEYEKYPPKKKAEK